MCKVNFMNLIVHLHIRTEEHCCQLVIKHESCFTDDVCLPGTFCMMVPDLNSLSVDYIEFDSFPLDMPSLLQPVFTALLKTQSIVLLSLQSEDHVG